MEEKDKKEKGLVDQLAEWYFELRDQMVEGYFELLKQASCEHERIIGDNYGETCQDCGLVVSGFGGGCVQKTCRHKWGKSEGGSVCIFCGKEK
jgi:hypothetical protein